MGTIFRIHQALFVLALALGLQANVALCQPTDTLRPRLLWKHEQLHGVLAYAFSHSGSLLALANNREIKFWDLKAKRFVRTIPFSEGNASQMAFATGDTELLVIYPRKMPPQKYDGMRDDIAAPISRLFSLAKISLPTGETTSIEAAESDSGKWTLSPDGRYVVSLHDEDGLLAVYDSHTFRRIQAVSLPVDTGQPSLPMRKAVPPVMKNRKVVEDSLRIREVQPKRDITTKFRPNYRRSPNGSVLFGLDGHVLIVRWYNKLSIYDPQSLAVINAFTGGFGYSSTIVGEGLFESQYVVDIESARPSHLQPRPLITTSAPHEKPVEITQATSAILFGKGNYLASRYRLGSNSNSNLSASMGDDTLLITSRAHPEGEWGIRVSGTTSILDVVPGSRSELLLLDQGSLSVVNVKTHAIQNISTAVPAVQHMFGFTNNNANIIELSNSRLIAVKAVTGETIWKQPLSSSMAAASPNGNYLIARTDDSTLAVYNSSGQQIQRRALPGRELTFKSFIDDDHVLVINEPRQDPASYRTRAVYDGTGLPAREYGLVGYQVWKIPSLETIGDVVNLDGRFARIFPADHGSVLLTDGSDTAKLFDALHNRMLNGFIGGLNYGMSSTAISHDGKWIATVSLSRSGKLWRASDGALKVMFERIGPQAWARGYDQMVFTPNDRYLLYAGGQYIVRHDLNTGDTMLFARDAGSISSFEQSQDGSKLAVVREDGRSEMYETPLAWRINDKSFNPKTVYLPLRFYLPADAPEAIDTTGRPFSPARTHVMLELLDGDGKVVKKILDGPFHKGKWHEWDLDATDYPKGKYLMHTIIGGVEHFEEKWVR